jgi:site-specific recombinase XerC
MDERALILLDDWEDHLRAGGRSPKTIRSYLDTVRLFARSVDPVTAETREITRWIGRILPEAVTTRGTSYSSASIALHRRNLVQWFRFLVEIGVREASPMAGVPTPKVVDNPPPVIEPDVVRRLLGACTGPAFVDRRDAAILWVLFDCGVRLGEIAGIRVNDVRRDGIVVTGKGNRVRTVPYGRKAGRAISTYLISRSRHRHADLDALWLGQQGPLTDSGIAQMVRRRARQAHAGPLHPHQFRHTFSYLWRLAGGSEGDLQHLGGWADAKMPAWYGRAAAATVAREAHQRYSPGDRL